MTSCSKLMMVAVAFLGDFVKFEFWLFFNQAKEFPVPLKNDQYKISNVYYLVWFLRFVFV